MAAMVATGAAALMNLLVLLGMAFVLSRGFGLLRSRPETQRTAILSVAFAVMAVGSMMVSFPIGPGIIGDFRNAVIAIAAIIGGPIPALAAAAAAAAFRMYLGGQFTTAVIGIAIAAALSIAFNWSKLPKSPLNMVLFGVALAAGNALLPIVASLLSAMPMSRAFGVATTIFVVAVVLYPLVITVIGGLLNSEQQRAVDEAELRAINAVLSLDTGRVRREGLKVDLAAALSNNEFKIEYQPIVSVQTGAVVSFEALLRWHHPRNELVTPNEFIPLAEEANLIGSIGAWVLDQACKQATTWPAHIGVAVNVSPLQLRGTSLAARVAEALDKSGLNPVRLELEITETVLIHGGEDNLQSLRDLHELGVKVALDDFGTGYSSLSYLKRFPFDRIKIDRSFVGEVTSGEEAKAVIKAVVTLGHSLKMRITAEGVETLDQLDRVRAKGCDEAQGFLISKSVPPSELAALITTLAARLDMGIVPHSAVAPSANRTGSKRDSDRASGSPLGHLANPGGPAFALAENDELFQSMVEHAAVGMVVVGTDARVIYGNRSYCDMFGYTPAQVVGLGVADLVHPDDTSPAGEQLGQLTRGEIESYHAERLYKRKDGSPFRGKVSASIFRDERSGNPLYFILQFEDIDQQKRIEAALLARESRSNFALEGAGQGVWDHDVKRGGVFYSPAWRRMRGIGLDEEIDGSRDAWLARVHPDDRQRLSEQSDRLDAGELAHNDFEYRERHRDGHYIWILSRGRPIEWLPDGSIARIIGTDTDITSLKVQEARATAEAAEDYRRHLAALENAHEAAEAAQRLAQSLARHDALTGLPNRRVFSEALEVAIGRANRGAGVYAILIIDLDRFKPVNDIYGHPVGDTVLCEVATRLIDVVGQSDTLVRLGGDEFGVILECATPGQSPADAAVQLANRIIDCVQQPMNIGDHRVEIGGSVGIALCPADGANSEMLLRAADIAMYRAKEDGRGAFCFFQHSMEVDLRVRAALEHEVRQAVISEEIQPYYQPLMKLAENRLVGFEILARWHHPVRGDVPPDTFIPVAERLGLVNQLTYNLLRRACLDAKDWPPDLTIALNVSPKHFSDPLLPVKLLAILSETGFSPNRLEIEVTENALAGDLTAARAVLVALQAIGIKISLDDFGTGYASLYHLRELRFDKIKIDRSFVLSMGTNAESAKIVHSVIDLARSLGLPTIVEGIEHSETMKHIIESGGEYGQGFYFSKAIPAEEATRLVHAAAELNVRHTA